MIPAPDPEALEYLEVDLDTDCLPFSRYDTTLGEGQLAVVTIHSGFQHETNSQRPLFQVVADYPGGKACSIVDRPCAACYDLSRSWNCPDHHEPFSLGSALALSAVFEED